MDYIQEPIRVTPSIDHRRVMGSDLTQDPDILDFPTFLRNQMD